MSKNINIMFYNSTVLRTCCLIITVLLIVCCASEIPIIPAINSIIIDSKICTAIKCKYQLKLTGEPYLGHYSWRLTNKEQLRGSTCDIFYPNYEVVEKYTSQKFTDVELTLSATSDKIYFCVHLPSEKSYFSKHWVHQGVNIFVQPIEPSKNIENNDLQQSQQVILEPWADLSHDTDVNYVPADHNVRPRANVEIYVNGQYVPANTVYRKKREVLKASIRNYVNVKNQSEISTKNLNITNLNKIYLEEKAKNKLLDNNVKEVLNNSNLNLLHILNNNTVLSVKEFLYNKSSVNTNHIVKNNTTDLSSHINVVKNDKVVNDTLKKQVQSIVQTEALNKSTINEDHINMMKELDVEENRSKLLSLNTLIPIKQKKTLTQQLKAENQLKEDNQNTKSNLETQVTHPGVIEVRNTEDMIEIDGLRLDKTVKGTEILDDGVPSVLATSPMTLRLFGKHLTERTVIVFTNDKLKYGQPCKFFFNGEYKAKPGAVTAKSAIFEVKAPPLLPDSHNFLYICAKNLQPGKTITEDDGKYYHMGTDTFVTIAIHEKILPVWASIIIILTCLTFSALFSGLNIGLMALDRTELKIIANAGTDEEKKYAKVIIPVRDNGNYLLCSILLGNVLVNSIFTILLDDLTSGLFAIIVSTIAIVILGEIAPQAICSRYGLMVGAKSIYITKFVMGVVGPMAYPMGKLLDYLLGEEIGNVYNRDRLKELVKLGTGQNDLDKEEINIISGALEMRKKTVAEVMTKLEDVFMLPITSVLDFETMSEMIQSGYSRIPVYEGKKNNIITVLFIKDLAFVDPDDNTPLRTICQYYQNPCNFVFEDVTLDIMFKQFKDGRKGHMAFVHRINSEGDGDPFYETIGLVTLEDVIEEMIQAEILDETDVFLDNRSKRRRRKQDFASFAERHENQRVHVSPQLIFATFQFMSTSVDAFKPDTVSENVLRRLLKQNIIQVIKTKGKDKNCPEMYIYQQGKPTDYFALILEGRVEVTVGRENLVFEAGPFTYFGEQALTQNINICDTPSPSKLGSIHNLSIDVIARNTFVPDYSVRAITETFYLIVKRSMYLAAKRATLMEKGALTKGTTSEQFDTEVDKAKKTDIDFDATMDLATSSKTWPLFASSEDDMSGGGDQKSRQVSPKTNPLPLRAIPSSPDRIRDNYRRQSECDEQEKLLKS